MDSRDERARRNVATEAGRAAHIAAAGVANGTNDPEAAYAAAAAVVLASDLRAPLSTRIESDGEVVIVPDGVSPNRQGWRARLANVERMLSRANVHGTDTFEGGTALTEALAEVRAMIDGAE